MGRRLRDLSIDTSALRHSPAFTRLFIGHTLSATGTQLTLLALFYQVQVITGSPLAVGLVGLAYAGPTVIFSLAGGVLAESSDRRRLLVIAQLALAGTSLGLAALAAGSPPPVWSLYALTAAAAVLHAIDNPTRTAIIPGLVGDRYLKSAIQLREVMIQSSRLIGPMIAGILIDIVGVTWLYAIDAATYLIAAALFLGLPSQLPGRVASRSWAAVQDGFRYLRTSRVLATTFYADLVAMIFGMPRAVFPALALDVYAVGGTGLGMMTAAIGLGGAVGALLSGWTSRVRREGLAVIISVAVFGTAIAAFGAIAIFWVGLVLLAIAGWADMISAIFRQSMLLQIAPDEMRGRMSAVHSSVVTGGPPLGDFEAGAAADLIGLRPSIIAGGAICVAGTVWLGLRGGREFIRWTAPPASAAPRA